MADQTKPSREERESELRWLMNSPGGHGKVLAILEKTLRIVPGTQDHIGTPLIQTILHTEYPNG